MAAAAAKFAEDRLNAANAFAQTMIVVDDEAGKSSPNGTSTPPAQAGRPTRADAAQKDEKKQGSNSASQSHPLDQRTLIDSALNLGLVCAVVTPERNKGIVMKVANAAERADIVSLDWRMHDTDGDDAKSIINEIVRRDARKGGRLRLIAIYTGVRDRAKIFADILESFSENQIEDLNIRESGDRIVSDNGLRIVWLFKAGGTQLTGNLAEFQVDESELAGKLLKEFAELSQGLLSNVALATIASVRDSTHHVLGKFSGMMDGPYFHHRSFLKYPGDAEDYAVSIVLSELKSAVDKTEVAATMAGKPAIANRISHLAAKGADLTFKCDPVEKKLTKKEVISLVSDGWSNLDQNTPTRNLGLKNVKANCTSLFEVSQDAGRKAMMAFASLTGTRSHPGSFLYGKMPQLGLGSVIHSTELGYLLCLQASCDMVRITAPQEFYFVPLVEEKGMPDHVVPVTDSDGDVDYLGLNLVDSAYTKSISLTFPPNGEESDATVRAKTAQGRKGFFFEDSAGKAFSWIANLKERRAMRSAQWVGIEMGRIGFDEFEPFRPDPKPEK